MVGEILQNIILLIFEIFCIFTAICKKKKKELQEINEDTCRYKAPTFKPTLLLAPLRKYQQMKIISPNTSRHTLFILYRVYI